MSRPGTFERVYSAIKERLRQGAFRPGDRLEPAVLSEQLNASVTPVRDALHRLTGERLVEAPRHEGFRTPMLTETTLRHLYAWHRDLVLLAIAGRASRNEQLGKASDLVLGAGAGEAAADDIFAALARSSGNPEHAAALESIAERLRQVRHAEADLIDAAEEQMHDIVSALRDRDVLRLRSCLVRYHRRRDLLVPRLIERLHSD